MGLSLGKFLLVSALMGCKVEKHHATHGKFAALLGGIHHHMENLAKGQENG